MQTTTNYNLRKFEDTDKTKKALTEDLSFNFDTIDAQMKANSGNGIQTLTSPVRIWGLDDGVYKLPHGCTIYHDGGTSTANFSIASDGIMFVTSYVSSDTVARKQFFIFTGTTSSTNRSLYHGYSTSSAGSYSSLSLTSVLTSISSYVKNQLDYSTSSTSYALSAYQGYVLDNKKINGNSYITDVWKGTQTEYDNLGTYSNTTLYLIEET